MAACRKFKCGFAPGVINYIQVILWSLESIGLSFSSTSLVTAMLLDDVRLVSNLCAFVLVHEAPPRAGARTILLQVQCGFRTFTKLIHVKLWGVHLVKRVTCMALMFHTVIRTRFLFLMYGEALAKRDSRVIWEIIICKEQCCHKAYVRFQLA